MSVDGIRAGGREGGEGVGGPVDMDAGCAVFEAVVW